MASQDPSRTPRGAFQPAVSLGTHGLTRRYSQAGIPIAAPQVLERSPFATRGGATTAGNELERCPWLVRCQFAHDNDGFKEGDPVEICDCGDTRFKGKFGVLGLFDKELAMWRVIVADVGSVRCDVHQLRNLAANKAETAEVHRLLPRGTQVECQFAHDNDGFKEGDPVEICDCGATKFEGKFGFLGLFHKDLALWTVIVAFVGSVRCDVHQLRNLAANQAEIAEVTRLLPRGTQVECQFAHDNDGFKEGDPVEICDCGATKFEGKFGFLGLFHKDLALWTVIVAFVGSVRCDVHQLRNLAANQAEIAAAPRLLQRGTQLRAPHDPILFSVSLASFGLEQLDSTLAPAPPPPPPPAPAPAPAPPPAPSVAPARGFSIVTFGLRTLNMNHHCNYSDDVLIQALADWWPAFHADVVIDARPFHDPGQKGVGKGHTGMHREILTRIAWHHRFSTWYQTQISRVLAAPPQDPRRNRMDVGVAIYCAAGKHRSVAASIFLAVGLRDRGFAVAEPRHLSMATWPACHGSCRECTSAHLTARSLLQQHGLL